MYPVSFVKHNVAKDEHNVLYIKLIVTIKTVLPATENHI